MWVHYRHGKVSLMLCIVIYCTQRTAQAYEYVNVNDTIKHCFDTSSRAEFIEHVSFEIARIDENPPARVVSSGAHSQVMLSEWKNTARGPFKSCIEWQIEKIKNERMARKVDELLKGFDAFIKNYLAYSDPGTAITHSMMKALIEQRDLLSTDILELARQFTRQKDDRLRIFQITTLHMKQLMRPACFDHDKYMHIVSDAKISLSSYYEKLMKEKVAAAQKLAFTPKCRLQSSITVRFANFLICAKDYPGANIITDKARVMRQEYTRFRSLHNLHGTLTPMNEEWVILAYAAYKATKQHDDPNALLHELRSSMPPVNSDADMLITNCIPKLAESSSNPTEVNRSITETLRCLSSTYDMPGFNGLVFDEHRNTPSVDTSHIRKKFEFYNVCKVGTGSHEWYAGTQVRQFTFCAATDEEVDAEKGQF